MTIKRQSFEGGTNNTNITVAGSGGASGDQIDQLIINGSSTPGGGATFKWLTAAGLVGSMGCRAQPSSTSVSYLRFNASETANRFTARLVFRLDALPLIDVDLIQMHNGSAIMGAAALTTAGKIVAKAGSSTISGSTSTTTLSAGTIYALECSITKETGGGGNGVVEWWLGPANSTTPHETPYVSSATRTTGTLNVQSYRIGTNSTNSFATFYDIDDIAWGANASGWAGPAANVAPTVDAGADQTVAAGATVSLSISANDSDGSISSYATTVTRYTSGSNPASVTVTGSTTATPSWTAGSAGSLDVATVTVTDNGGATASDTVEVCVLQTAADLNPLRGYTPVTAGTWTNTGGATSAGAAVADSSDSTYAESAGASGTVQTFDARLEPATPRPGLTLSGRLYHDVSGSVVVKMRLLNDGVLLQETTKVPTTSVANYTVDYTSSIADARKLYLGASIVSA